MMPPTERQSAILQYLTEKGFAAVAALAQEFSVSEMTIRRDLAELEGQRATTHLWRGNSL